MTKQDEVAQHVLTQNYGVKPKVCFDPPIPKVGKGKALKHAISAYAFDISRRILIAFPDDLFLDKYLPIRFLSSHLDARRRLGVWASTAVTTAVRSQFGIVDVDFRGLATVFTEKALVPLCSSVGLYIFEPEVLRLIDELIDIERDEPIEFENTILPRLAEEEKLHAFIVPSGVWIPINTLKDLEEAEKLIK